MENRQEEAALKRDRWLVYQDVGSGKNEVPSQDKLRGYQMEMPVVGLMVDKEEEKGKGVGVAAPASWTWDQILQLDEDATLDSLAVGHA